MASKVQQNCIKVGVKTGNIESAVKVSLMANIEGGNMVYLDNAKADCTAQGMTAHQFAGGLAALTAKGIYTQTDGYFGKLNLSKE